MSIHVNFVFMDGTIINESCCHKETCVILKKRLAKIVDTTFNRVRLLLDTGVELCDNNKNLEDEKVLDDDIIHVLLRPEIHLRLAPFLITHKCTDVLMETIHGCLYIFDSISDFVFRYNTMENQWDTVSKPKKAMCSLCKVFQVNNHLYFVKPGMECTVEKFDIDRNEWFEVASIKNKRYTDFAYIYESFLYSSIGIVVDASTNDEHDVLVRFNVESNQCETILVQLDDFYNRFIHKTTMVDGVVYVFHSFFVRRYNVSTSCCITTECCGKLTEKYSEVVTSFCGVTDKSNGLYCIFSIIFKLGCGKNESIRIYNLNSNTFSLGPDPPFSHTSNVLGIASIDDIVYILVLESETLSLFRYCVSLEIWLN